MRGDQQCEGLDYTETFATVVKSMSYKALFAIAASLDWEIEQMDVKTAFLYGLIPETVYMQQPEYFAGKHPGKVCKLRKALYKLKQSPRIWYQTLTDFLSTLQFKPLLSDPLVFHCEGMFITVYMDDLLMFRASKKEIAEVKQALSDKFSMSDLGPCRYYLRMEII